MGTRVKPKWQQGPRLECSCGQLLWYLIRKWGRVIRMDQQSDQTERGNLISIPSRECFDKVGSSDMPTGLAKNSSWRSVAKSPRWPPVRVVSGMSLVN